MYLSPVVYSISCICENERPDRNVKIYSVLVSNSLRFPLMSLLPISLPLPSSFLRMHILLSPRASILHSLQPQAIIRLSYEQPKKISCSGRVLCLPSHPPHHSIIPRFPFSTLMMREKLFQTGNWFIGLEMPLVSSILLVRTKKKDKEKL